MITKELCNYCKSKKCKNIALDERENLKIIRCEDYEKDESKIKGYIKPIVVTARRKNKDSEKSR